MKQVTFFIAMLFMVLAMTFTACQKDPEPSAPPMLNEPGYAKEIRLTDAAGANQVTVRISSDDESLAHAMTAADFTFKPVFKNDPQSQMPRELPASGKEKASASTAGGRSLRITLTDSQLAPEATGISLSLKPKSEGAVDRTPVDLWFTATGNIFQFVAAGSPPIELFIRWPNAIG